MTPQQAAAMLTHREAQALALALLQTVDSIDQADDNGGLTGAAALSVLRALGTRVRPVLQGLEARA